MIWSRAIVDQRNHYLTTWYSTVEFCNLKYLPMRIFKDFHSKPYPRNTFTTWRKIRNTFSTITPYLIIFIKQWRNIYFDDLKFSSFGRYPSYCVWRDYIEYWTFCAIVHHDQAFCIFLFSNGFVFRLPIATRWNNRFKREGKKVNEVYGASFTETFFGQRLLVFPVGH